MSDKLKSRKPTNRSRQTKTTKSQVCTCNNCLHVYGDLNHPPNKQSIVRPSWDEYFLKIAEAVSSRSYDAQTKVGAVITDSEHHIIGTGYNSFPPGMPDKHLPNIRPYKYVFVSHAEIAAISNCVVSPQHLKDGATIYLTMEPCFECFKVLLHNNIKRVVAYSVPLSKKSAENRDVFNMMLHNAILSGKLEEYKIVKH